MPVVIDLPQATVQAVVRVAIPVLGPGVAARLSQAYGDGHLAVSCAGALPCTCTCGSPGGRGRGEGGERERSECVGQAWHVDGKRVSVNFRL